MKAGWRKESLLFICLTLKALTSKQAHLPCCSWFLHRTSFLCLLHRLNGSSSAGILQAISERWGLQRHLAPWAEPLPVSGPFRCERALVGLLRSYHESHLVSDPLIWINSADFIPLENTGYHGVGVGIGDNNYSHGLVRMQWHNTISHLNAKFATSMRDWK